MKRIDLNKLCFRIEKENAHAMIKGYEYNGNHFYQAIYCLAQNKEFPRLLTIHTNWSKFELSTLGKKVKEDFSDFHYKYIVDLDSYYFIKNNMNLWNTICKNGLFNIWMPEAPYNRFRNAKRKPELYRIALLRVYEINERFNKTDFEFKGREHQYIKKFDRTVTIKKALIDDKTFKETKELLLESISPYLNKIENNDSINVLNTEENLYPSEISKDELSKYFEGTKKTIIVNAYERNNKARKKCLEIYKLNCFVCGFNFEKNYGERGKGFIHVHHLKPLSELGKSYNIDPIKDLRPICPNCHGIIHYKKPMISIEKLKEFVREQKEKI